MVLDKAKKRTGIENGTDGQPQPGVSLNGVTQSFVQSGLNIMAEAASVGGLGEVEIVHLPGNGRNTTSKSI